MKDVTSQTSFGKAQQWIDELKVQAKPGVVIMLAANKLDLVQDGHAEKAVATADGERFAAENNLLFLETSAKTGLNVNLLFLNVAKVIPKQAPALRAGIQLNGLDGDDSTSSGCCHG